MRYRVTSWDIAEGDRVSRSRLHDRFGGNRQRGIAPSRQSPNIFLFSNPRVGDALGYQDDLSSDPVLYSGEGRTGDQRLLAGNAAVLKHKESGRALRLFRVFEQEAEYVGEFQVDAETPYVLTNRESMGSTRRVFIFRLRKCSATN